MFLVVAAKLKLQLKPKEMARYTFLLWGQAKDEIIIAIPVVFAEPL